MINDLNADDDNAAIGKLNGINILHNVKSFFLPNRVEGIVNGLRSILAQENIDGLQSSARADLATIWIIAIIKSVDLKAKVGLVNKGKEFLVCWVTFVYGQQAAIEFRADKSIFGDLLRD